MSQRAVLSFEGVQESEDQFLALFPHRYDYIWADHPSPDQSPAWKTESRHPLTDRLVQQGASLYGVRFGKTTRYCLFDIDAGSRYHPQRDPFAIGRIVAALEPLGLVSYLACTSSYSGGLHLYFPFPEAQETWSLAIVLSTLLERTGFKLQPGQLEVFPNTRTYIPESLPSLFNAHRLPMQSGSYLLNSDFEPVCSDQQTFVQHWQRTQQHNDLNRKTIDRLLRQYRRNHYRVTGKAEKFINDLSTEIEFGWTGSGQTNRLLGRIAMRAYVFHHVIHGGEPLEGQRLVEEIVKTARSLPGYDQWCRHRHEIEQRAIEWARCVESSRYFHYGEACGKYRSVGSVKETTSEQVNWNQQQSQATRERIRLAIADLLEKQQLASGATARFRQLLTYGVGGASLYRHRDLWHPACLVEAFSSDEMDDTLPSSVENFPEIHNQKIYNFGSNPLDCAGGASNGQSYPSLLQATGGNRPGDGLCSDRDSLPVMTTGSNCPGGQVVLRQEHNPSWRLDRSTWTEIQQEAVKMRRQTVSSPRSFLSATYVARLQHYLESGDPILVAEAQAWAEMNPGVLDLSRINLPVEWQLPEKIAIEARDLSSLLATIAVHTQRLQLSPEQVRQRLQQMFGRSTLVCLEDMELVAWCLYLEAQPDAGDDNGEVRVEC